MAKDKKTLKFQMMMSPAEAEALDDWMFRKRVRSRAEAIRRLCQIGMLADEKRVSTIAASIDIAQASESVERAIDPVYDLKEVSDEIKSNIYSSIMTQRGVVSKLLYDTCKSAIEAFPYVVGLPMEESFKEARALKEKLDNLDFRKKEDIDELLRMMAVLYPSRKNVAEAQETASDEPSVD